MAVISDIAMSALNTLFELYVLCAAFHFMFIYFVQENSKCEHNNANALGILNISKVWCFLLMKKLFSFFTRYIYYIWLVKRKCKLVCFRWCCHFFGLFVSFVCKIKNAAIRFWIQPDRYYYCMQHRPSMIPVAFHLLIYMYTHGYPVHGSFCCYIFGYFREWKMGSDFKCNVCMNVLPRW